VNSTKISPIEKQMVCSAEHLVKRSLLYREFQAEHAEILRHKWYESEKMGYDIGFELAQVDWRIKHGSLWRREWKQKRLPSAFAS